MHLMRDNFGSLVDTVEKHFKGDQLSTENADLKKLESVASEVKNTYSD